MAKTNLRLPTDLRPLPRGSGRIVPCRAALALAADRRVVTQLAHICDDMAAYDVRYPAAVEVRIHLGAAKWEKLERYRTRIAEFAAMMRHLEREELPIERALVDKRYYPAMLAYLMKACGGYVEEIFQCHHDTMDDMLQYDTEEDVGVQDSASMCSVREMFHRRPYLWFMYNLYFPVKGLMGEPGRMSWVQLKDWAIWTLQNPLEEPSWFRCEWLAAEWIVPLKDVTDADVMYNAALIEVYTDVAARFA